MILLRFVRFGSNTPILIGRCRRNHNPDLWDGRQRLDLCFYRLLSINWHTARNIRFGVDLAGLLSYGMKPIEHDLTCPGGAEIYAVPDLTRPAGSGAPDRRRHCEADHPQCSSAPLTPRCLYVLPRTPGPAPHADERGSGGDCVFYPVTDETRVT